MEEKFVSLEQLRLMPQRVLFAEETTAASELGKLLWEIKEENDYKPTKMLIVGAGGSFPAALLAKQVLSDDCRTSDIEAVTPQTAIRILTQFSHIGNCDYKPYYHLVVAISYSGKTPDIKNVYEVCVACGIQFLLISKAPKWELEEMYPNFNRISTNVISYYNKKDNTGNERGMISMASTLSPIVIFDDLEGESKSENQECFNEGKAFVEKLDLLKISNSLKQTPIINVFYEWDTMPAAYDIESKFTESGIANVILHEKKNFSHGRYVSLYNLKSGLNIVLTKFAIGINIPKNSIDEGVYRTPYDKELETFVEKMSVKSDTPYLRISSCAFTLNQWNIEVMTKLPYLIVAIGEQLGIDISKPLQPFPEEPKSLFNYVGKF